MSDSIIPIHAFSGLGVGLWYGINRVGDVLVIDKQEEETELDDVL